MDVESEAVRLRRLRRLCLFLLAANLAYCAVSSLGGKAPAWGMFSRVERLDYSLADKDGKAVDLRAYLPPVFYMANRDILIDAAACACRKSPATTPWRLTLPALGIARTVCAR
jgi:hypothetical protein